MASAAGARCCAARRRGRWSPAGTSTAHTTAILQSSTLSSWTPTTRGAFRVCLQVIDVGNASAEAASARAGRKRRQTSSDGEARAHRRRGRASAQSRARGDSTPGAEAGMAVLLIRLTILLLVSGQCTHCDTRQHSSSTHTHTHTHTHTQTACSQPCSSASQFPPSPQQHCARDAEQPQDAAHECCHGHCTALEAGSEVGKPPALLELARWEGCRQGALVLSRQAGPRREHFAAQLAPVCCGS